MTKTRKKRLQARDSERVEPSAENEAPGEISVQSSKTESAPEGTESERIDVGDQESEAQKTGSGVEDLSSGDSGEAGAKDSQIKILPLWAWGLVMIVSFLIAFWLVNTYVLGAP